MNFFDNHYATAHDVYENDAKHPPIVQAAATGDLKKIKRLLNNKEKISEVQYKTHINKARIWKEVQEKWGYDKEWDWYDDTPLIAAVRNNQAEIVKFLLDTGYCDPCWESCPTDDVYETALKVAEKNKNDAILKMIKVALNHWPEGRKGAQAGDSKTDNRNYKERQMSGDLPTMKSELENALKQAAPAVGKDATSKTNRNYNY